MWKLTRNVVLLTAVLAAALRLLLWVAAQQQAGSIAAQLAPWLDLRYGGVGSGFDGALRLKDVDLVLRRGAWREPIHLDSLSIDAGGPLWLLGRAVSRGDSLPDQIHVEASGLHWPKGLQSSTAAWLEPRSGIAFDHFGCGDAPFTDKDYSAMGRSPQAATLALDLSRDKGSQDLQIDLHALQPPFASLRFRLEVKPFDFAMLDDAKAQAKARIASASLNYRDDGYFAARSRYCAQRLGSSIEGYVDRHMAAVAEFLTAHHVDVAPDSLAMYRDLLLRGGEVEWLSLPNAALAPVEYAAHERQEVLRYLNVTARRDQAPPILFKLTFTSPAETEADAVVVAPPAEAAPAATAPIASPPSVVANTPTPISAPVVPPPVATAPTVVTASPSPSTSPTSTALTPPPLTAPSTTAPTVVTAPKPSKAPSVVVTPTATSSITEKMIDPETGKPVSSIEAPTGDSTLALVWKGATVERLPTPTQAERPYTVVSFDALGGYRGQRVMLITEGGKEIEGRVVSADAIAVVMQLRRQTGSAELSVARARIREVRVPRPIARE